MVRTLATDAYDMFDKTGKAFFIVDAGLSGMHAFDAYEQNDWWGENGVAKNLLDIGMGAIGVYGGLPGFAVASTYFAVDKLFGWNNVGTVINTSYKVDQESLDEYQNTDSVWKSCLYS